MKRYAVQLISAVGVLALGLGATIAPAPAAGAEGRMYGAGAPFTIEDLPPGQLRSSLDRLPPRAQGRALGWLHRFSFPAADVDHLRIDAEGGVFYEDPIPEAQGPEAAEAIQDSAATLGEISFTQAFSLHSRPGSVRTVYLDFDGHVVSGTIWNGTYPTLYMRPYDFDGSDANYSPDELNAIAEIWRRVAEDFAPFDVDVTTEEPPAFGPTVGHVLFTRKADQYGNPIYSCNCGGAAYVDVWGANNYTYFQPALVFIDGGTGVHNIAEAASHEFGHNLGMGHDGVIGGSAYYGGHGTGYVDWAPIMGVGYGGHVTQWSKGEYLNANNTQDDFIILLGRLGRSPDDHVNSNYGLATPLVVSGGTSIQATTPVSDPDKLSRANKGIIENSADVDLFSVDVGTGTLDLTVTPAWIETYSTALYRGANLDIKATLYSADGVLLAQSDPTDDTYARITATLSAGRYILAVEGVGVGDPLTSGYSDYASIGQYFINGTVPAAASDTTPPTPNPMNWALAPAATGPDRITMQASAAVDASGSVVQYLFQCVSGGSGCVDSGWQGTPSYTATGLAGGTSYGFQAKARDAAGNETNPTALASATTQSASIHVGSLAGWGSAAPKGNWHAVVSVLVHDAAHQPVPDVAVSGSWSSGASGGGSCVTNSSGECAITKPNLKGTVARVTFTVNGLAKTGSTYNAGSNHQATITVNNPKTTAK